MKKEKDSNKYGYIPELEEFVEIAWRFIQLDWFCLNRYNDKYHKKVKGREYQYSESDIQSFLFNYLNHYVSKFDGLEIFTESTYKGIKKTGGSGRPDIIIEKNGKPHFVFEIKVKDKLKQIRKIMKDDTTKLANMRDIQKASRIYFVYIVIEETKKIPKGYLSEKYPQDKKRYIELAGFPKNNKWYSFSTTIQFCENSMCESYFEKKWGYCPYCGETVPK